MKLTKQEQSNLSGLINEIKRVESAIGQLELQKANAIDAMRGMMKALDEVKGVLTEKYGDVQIDVASGNITKTDEETK